MKTAIVTSFDKNYIEPSSVVLKSLSSNYHGEDPLDVVCLVAPDILEHEKAYVNLVNAKNLNISFRCSPEYVSMVDSGHANSFEHISKHANHRVFLGSTLPEYDKVIYLDADIVICRDVSPLLNFNMTHKIHALIEFHSTNVSSFGNPDIPYFNDGMFIADLNYWRSSGAEEKMLSFIKENNPVLLEQDAMNKIFIDVVGPLPFSFNSFHYWLSDRELAVYARLNSNPLIVHFCGGDKPWNFKMDTKWSTIWENTYKEIYGREVMYGN